MPYRPSAGAPTKFPEPQYVSLGNFRRGCITLITPSRVPKNALVSAKNHILVEDGQPSQRPGVAWFGSAIPNVSAPGAATLALTTGSALGTGVYQYVVTYVNANGETTAGTTASITTTTGNQAVNLTAIPTGDNGVTKRNLYRTKVGGSTFYLLATIGDNTTTTYSDTKTDATLSTITVPTTNTATRSIDGFDYFDTGSTIHLVVVAGGNVYRSTNDGSSFDLCTGATLTPGYDVWPNQNGSFLYLPNGHDNLIRYNGTTTLQTYTALTTPSAPTIATTPASPGTGYTYYYEISAVNAVGFSLASAATSVVHGVSRDNWDNTTNFVTLTLPAYQSGQTRYDIYFSQDGVNYQYLDSVTNPNLTYKDNGSAVVVPSTLAPTGNTSQGPVVGELTNIGVRQYGVRDPNNLYRIWFTGAGQFAGAFSDAYDGGYLDWQPGGKFFPVHTEDYHDGKGSPIATVWCNSADGQGCVIQLSLDTLTVGTVSITVPSAFRLPGSRGTPAPRSVCPVLNDYLFYNSQAMYNIGPRMQLLNILSTDEISANIRPNVRAITRSAESKICTAYYYANVYVSIPTGGSTTNNVTMIYNAEMQAWMPEAFDIGFSRFLHYTDTNKQQHLLAIKPGDNRLTEIGFNINNASSTIQGDYGQPFDLDLLTGLLPVLPDRFEFAYVDEAEFEFSNPQGKVFVELLGYDRSKGYGSVKIVPVNNSSTIMTAGWDTFGWDLKNWDDTSVVPVVSSETSAKRFTYIQRELNNVQWHVYAFDLAAAYILRALQTRGTPTENGQPPSWRVNSL